MEIKGSSSELTYFSLLEHPESAVLFSLIISLCKSVTASSGAATHLWHKSLGVRALTQEARYLHLCKRYPGVVLFLFFFLHLRFGSGSGCYRSLLCWLHGLRCVLAVFIAQISFKLRRQGLGISLHGFWAGEEAGWEATALWLSHQTERSIVSFRFSEVGWMMPECLLLQCLDTVGSKQSYNCLLNLPLSKIQHANA